MRSGVPKFFVFWSWMWIALGVLAVLAGIALLLGAWPALGRDGGGKTMGWILIALGALRCFNSVYLLRRVLQGKS